MSDATTTSSRPAELPCSREPVTKAIQIPQARYGQPDHVAAAREFWYLHSTFEPDRTAAHESLKRYQQQKIAPTTRVGSLLVPRPFGHQTACLRL